MEAAPPLPLLKASVMCFLRQSETRKTLRVAQTSCPALRYPVQRFAAHLASPDLCLDQGDKSAVEDAYVCQWPAHRLCHPELLRRQADALSSTSAGAVELAEALVLLAPSRELFWVHLSAITAADPLNLHTRMVRPDGSGGVERLRHDVPLVMFVVGELEGPADAVSRTALTEAALSANAVVGRGANLCAALRYFAVPWPVTLIVADRGRNAELSLDPWSLA
jgi:hypothetical protein